MPNVRFKTTEIASELTCLARNSGKFLGPGSGHFLEQAARDLRQIGRGAAAANWSIPDEPGRRIRTIVSDGEYQFDKKGAHYLVGEMCWTMGLVPVSRDIVEVSGNASVKILLYVLAQAEDVELITPSSVHPRSTLIPSAMEINLDTGVPGGPGPMIHAQMKSMYSGNAKAFGSEIDVPRIPGMLSAPSEILDFLLNQLFQESWPRHFVGYNLVQSPTVWSDQRARFRTMLQNAAVAIGGSRHSAWGWMRTWAPSFA